MIGSKDPISALMGRRLARLTRKLGGDERAARIELIGIIIDKQCHMRRRPEERWRLGRVISELMLAELWRPLIPWMVEIVGPQFGLLIQPEEFTPPYPGFDAPIRRRRAAMLTHP